MPDRGIKRCQLVSMFNWLVECHTWAAGPTAPQALATGWLGPATPAWPGYESASKASQRMGQNQLIDPFLLYSNIAWNFTSGNILH